MLCSVLLFSRYSNAQEILTTGNLVNFTGTPTATTGNWVNGVYVNSLTCWQPGGPGNCGPYPNVQTNGNINFSYGQVNLNQVVNINNALAAAGTGVQISGFNFGFRAKNGNGWDNGQQDYLAAYVNIYNAGGRVVENYDYTQYTNRRYNWSNFNFTETFSKPYDIAKLGAAQFGFIGRDTNGWAGPYGPEIQNVSFSLNYKTDPCAANPASNPSCPGFSNLVKSTSVITSTAAATTNPTTSDTPSQTVSVGGVQLSTTGEIAAPDNVPQALKDVQAVSRQAQSSAPSPAVMSVVSRIQANERATQALSIQNSNRASAQATAKSQEQSMAIVESLNSMSMESSQAAQANSAAQQLIQSISQPMDMLGSSTVVSNYSMASAYVANRNATMANDAESSMLPMPTPQSRGTTLTALTEVRAIIESSQNEQRTETVKKDIQPNDLAGGVDIAAMATQPKGFDVYASTILADNSFYAPKDIYGNQKTVDNARALRQLSSDRLHQEMVDQQYRR